MKPPREIHLHIERLVLDGLPLDRSQSALFTTALEAELTDLFANRGLEPHLGTSGASVSAASLRLTASATPAAAGAQIAEAIYEAVGSTISQSRFREARAGGGRDFPAQNAELKPAGGRRSLT